MRIKVKRLKETIIDPRIMPLSFLLDLDKLYRKTGDSYEIINKVDKIIIRRTTND